MKKNKPQDDPYFIEVGRNGCPKCGHNKTWVVMGPDGCASSRDYPDQFEAAERAEDLNAAYYAGKASGRK